MGITDKLLNFMRLNEDDYDEDDYSSDYDDEEYEAPKKKVTKKTYDEAPSNEEKSFTKQRQTKNKVVPMRSRSGMQVCIYKPTSIEDGREISSLLVNDGTAVILNLEGIHVELAQRIIDFTSGSCCAISGNMQKISNYIFIATPPTVNISGEVQEILSGTASISDY